MTRVPTPIYSGGNTPVYMIPALGSPSDVASHSLLSGYSRIIPSRKTKRRVENVHCPVPNRARPAFPNLSQTLGVTEVWGGHISWESAGMHYVPLVYASRLRALSVECPSKGYFRAANNPAPRFRSKRDSSKATWLSHASENFRR